MFLNKKSIKYTTISNHLIKHGQKIIKTSKIFSTVILSHKIEDFINLKVLNHINLGYHLNLAFQGGGAKGVSYVGVYNAMKKLQIRIDTDEKNK